MTALTISRATARRFVLGRQGLWPGRRWQGIDGLARCLSEIEALQEDPLNVVARSHDIALWGRVAGYQPNDLSHLLYTQRAFFEWGGTLFVYPTAELPHWRIPMARRALGKRWAEVARTHSDAIADVREVLRERGPLGNRDFAGNRRVISYRGRKDSALALYYLWLTGEVMIHHREGFERVYDLCERIIPFALDGVPQEAEAEAYFARKATAFYGLTRARTWGAILAGFIDRPVSQPEARQRLEQILADGSVTRLQIEGSREEWVALTEDIPILHTLESGAIPPAWAPLGPTTEDEVIFLAPLDIVSARGRAKQLFDFDYIWEVYKPASARRWGYYTLPVLYGDRLVARLDPRLDRASGTLVINGFWREVENPPDEEAFAAALAQGLVSFARFLGANSVDLTSVAPAEERAWLAERIGPSLAIDMATVRSSMIGLDRA